MAVAPRVTTLLQALGHGDSFATLRSLRLVVVASVDACFQDLGELVLFNGLSHAAWLALKHLVRRRLLSQGDSDLGRAIEVALPGRESVTLLNRAFPFGRGARDLVRAPVLTRLRLLLTAF